MTLERRFSVPFVAVVAALVTSVIPAGRGGVALAGSNAPVEDGDSSAPPTAVAKVAFEAPLAALDYVQAHTLSGEELARRRATGDSVILQSGVFDPVTEALPEFAAGRRSPAPRRPSSSSSVAT